jgi:hypothetical protein
MVQDDEHAPVRYVDHRHGDCISLHGCKTAAHPPDPAHTTFVPFVFGRNSQCQPVRGVNTCPAHTAVASFVFGRNSQSQGFTVVMVRVRGSGRPRGMTLVTRKQVLQAGVGTNGILECKFLSKTRTVQQSQPDGANPNAAESMVEGVHPTTSLYFLSVESCFHQCQCCLQQRFDIIYGGNGKRSLLPRGMPLVTRTFASSEHAWDPMASSSGNFF